ncbi:MAG: class I SAM-dependent methyltransferase [Clostridia bacterium]|nr:class I SAM-dependent methyltransferase [Clostridia bacterium]
MQYGKLANLYDKFMSDVDYGAWADHIADLIPDGANVLEAGCGTGEISIRLARRGFTVTATDISEDMLIVASQKMRECGVGAPWLRFARMDMRSLASHKKVDCVLSCCDGVNYLLSREDVLRFFRSAADVLKPGGMLIFDVSSRHKLSAILGNNSFTDNGMDAAYLWQNTYDEGSKLIRMELSFFVRKGELYERFDETHIQRAHSVRELGSWLEEAGFSWKARGFLKDGPPSEDEERIEFIARKNS